MKYLSLILVAFVLVTSCGPEISPEPTEVTPGMQEKMDTIRAKLLKIVELLPAEGEEIEISPEGTFEGIGKIDESDLVRVFSLEEPHLISIANGAKDVEEVKGDGGAWFSSGSWEALDEKPLLNMFTPRHGKLMTEFAGMNYLVVVRTDYYQPGEIDGDEIIVAGECGVWIWLVDMKTLEIVASDYIETTTDDSIYTTSSGSDILASNLRSNITEGINDRMDRWSGTHDSKFVRHNDSNY
jgi:hypothetical protein